jgi:hypothetical protein
VTLLAPHGPRGAVLFKSEGLLLPANVPSKIFQKNFSVTFLHNKRTTNQLTPQT